MPLHTLNISTDIKIDASINPKLTNTNSEKSPEIAMFSREMEAKGLSMSDSIFITKEQRCVHFMLSMRKNPKGYNVKTNIYEQEYNIAMATLGSEIKKLMCLTTDQPELMIGANYNRMEDFEKKVLNVYVPLCELDVWDLRYQAVRLTMCELHRSVSNSDFDTETPQLLVKHFIDYIKFHRTAITNKLICPYGH